MGRLRPEFFRQREFCSGMTEGQRREWMEQDALRELRRELGGE